MTRVAFAIVSEVLVLTAALLVAGCAPPPQAAPTASGVRWELDVSPYRPVARQAVTLRLRALDSRGQPIPLQGFRATAVMPERPYRGETIPFREVEPGLYEAVHSFSMDGRWEVHIAGSVKGKRAEARIVLVVGGGP
ncbi:MAG TPA: FixH family protein [bacterium]